MGLSRQSNARNWQQNAFKETLQGRKRTISCYPLLKHKTKQITLNKHRLETSISIFLKSCEKRKNSDIDFAKMVSDARRVMHNLSCTFFSHNLPSTKTERVETDRYPGRSLTFKRQRPSAQFRAWYYNCSSVSLEIILKSVMRCIYHRDSAEGRKSHIRA